METFNIASFLPQRARAAPERLAVICDHAPDWRGRTALSFKELDAESDCCAWGLKRLGLAEGQRALLMVRPGLDFITLTFALFKLGAVPVLIDPGMGKKNLLDCMAQARPEAVIAVPQLHAARIFSSHAAFDSARLHVTVGRRWFWGGPTLAHVRRLGETARPFPMAATTRDSPAAILFTTGSTGIPKGVLYKHGMFGAQVDAIREQYGIEPGEVDLPAFPLFALFSTALGTTCVIPDMDPTRPAQCDPAKTVAAIQRHNVTYTFGSPSIWRRVGPYCLERGITLPSLKRILMAGAPVRGDVLEPFAKVLGPDADTHIPYGATEALPVASIRGSEVLGETWALTRQGKGYCVGRPLPGVTVKIIAETPPPTPPLSGEGSSNQPADMIAEGSSPPSLLGKGVGGLGFRVLPDGEIGEIVVKGDAVTQEYFELPEATRAAKIYETRNQKPETRNLLCWHRMGDMGYFDTQGRLWFCGRKAHRVILEGGRVLYSVCAEAVVENLIQEKMKRIAFVPRAALVGVGKPGSQTAVIVFEGVAWPPPCDYMGFSGFDDKVWRQHELSKVITEVLFYPTRFPVDIRHNAKINREELAKWAEAQLKGKQRSAAR